MCANYVTQSQTMIFIITVVVFLKLNKLSQFLPYHKHMIDNQFCTCLGSKCKMYYEMHEHVFAFFGRFENSCSPIFLARFMMPWLIARNLFCQSHLIHYLGISLHLCNLNQAKALFFLFLFVQAWSFHSIQQYLVFSLILYSSGSLNHSMKCSWCHTPRKQLICKNNSKDIFGRMNVQ